MLTRAKVFRRTVLSIATLGSLWSQDEPANAAPVRVLPGFLMQQESYSPYLDELGRVPQVANASAMVTLGHSKGAKQAAIEAAVNIPQPDVVILLEPVDVDPPGAGVRESALELWRQRQARIAHIPTLIVAAPFSGFSKRYGALENVCAPPGLDAEAFFKAASLARDEVKRKRKGQVAPLSLLRIPDAGHNQLVLSNIGGCGTGPVKPETLCPLVASLSAKWVAHVLSSGKAPEVLSLTDNTQPQLRLMFENYS